jgi:photosystem II stability/assembly factor-like uncharacterized protein
VTLSWFYRQTESMLSSPVIIAASLAAHVLAFEVAAMAQTDHYAVFSSHDRGRTWSPSHDGLPSSARINAFGVVRSALLTGTDNGIYISHDQGFHWKLASGAATDSGRILSFTTMAGSVYAGTDKGGVLASSDGGVTWVANAGVPFGKVRALLAQDGALYAGTDGQGVFVSRDGGRSWVPISAGLPSGGQIFTLAALKGRVFAGLYSKGLYVWMEQGQPTWHKIDTVSPLVLATTGETLLAGHNPGGIFRSDDSGATWLRGEIPRSENLGTAPVWELGGGANFALAGVSSGIYYSEDQGRTWQLARQGLPDGSPGIAFLVDRDFALAGVSVRPRK